MGTTQNLTYYKLRKKDDPLLFVRGTPMYQSYDSKGRVFQSLGAIRTFITGVMSSDGSYNKYTSGSVHKNRVADWEVVEYEIVERETKAIHEIITAKKLKELLMK